VIRVGLLLPTREAAIGADWDARRLVSLARQAEGLGFDSVWAGDSLLARPRAEPLTLLAAIAMATDSVTLGTAALTVPLRHPLQAAHAVTTLDRLCEGRLIIGMGAGFPYPASVAEFTALGVPFTERLGRLAETARILRLLWGGAETGAFTGKYWKFSNIDGFPKPFRPGGPGLWLAGAGPAALARAGCGFDGWLPYLPDPRVYRRSLTVIEASALAAGRPPEAVAPGLYLTVLPHDDPGAGRRELDAYTRAYYGQPLEAVEKIQGFVTGAPDHCTERMRAYADAGARHIVLRIGALDPWPLLEQVAEIARRARSWN
jgi:alkanesulfonate monooxygenase SsuD/methylene tetrahydromethanopterin reductase-like flavin-dependent oxidoreductase (luciferase family)